MQNTGGQFFIEKRRAERDPHILQMRLIQRLRHFKGQSAGILAGKPPHLCRQNIPILSIAQMQVEFPLFPGSQDDACLTGQDGMDHSAITSVHHKGMTHKLRPIRLKFQGFVAADRIYGQIFFRNFVIAAPAPGNRHSLSQFCINKQFGECRMGNIVSFRAEKGHGRRRDGDSLFFFACVLNAQTVYLHGQRRVNAHFAGQAESLHSLFVLYLSHLERGQKVPLAVAAGVDHPVSLPDFERNSLSGHAGFADAPQAASHGVRPQEILSVGEQPAVPWIRQRVECLPVFLLPPGLFPGSFLLGAYIADDNVARRNLFL